MNIFERVENLRRDQASLAFAEALVVNNVLKYLAIRAEFENYVIIALIFQEIMELHNSGMPHKLMDADFGFKTFAEVLSGEAETRNDLRRKESTTDFVLDKLHHRK
jgi:hypothetical protein